jgi:purine nucleosidase
MELMEFFTKTYKDAQGFDYPPVHDPCAVAYVIDPTVMTTRKVPVDIELQGKLTLGMTVADFRAPAPADCNTSVAVDLDHEKFWNLVTDAIIRIGEPDAGAPATMSADAAVAVSIAGEAK